MKELQKEDKYLIGGGLAIIGIAYLDMAIRRGKKEKAKKEIENQLSNANAQTAPVERKRQEWAQRIYAAFYEYAFGMAEDEEAVIKVASEMCVSDEPHVAKYYSLLSENKKNLFTDLARFMSSSDIARYKQAIKQC